MRMYFIREENRNNPIGNNRKGKLIFPLVVLLMFVFSGFASITAQTIDLTSRVALSTEYKNGIANCSTVTASPNSVAVGGTIIIVVTIIDEYHNPLQNHTVYLGAISVPGVSLTQLTKVTDANGQVFASLTSSVPGNFEVYAIDKTYLPSDNQEILVTQNAAVAFLSGTINKITSTLSASVAPTTIPTKTAPTLSSVPTTITPPITSTIIPPTPIPTAIITPTTSSNNNNLLLDLLGYSICGNDMFFYIILIILLLFVGIIIKISESREQAQESIFIYLFIYIIAMFLLRFMCLPIIPVMLGYAILILITIKPIRQKLFSKS